jgi:DNA-binding NarL/FixJ family response regulator
VNLEILVLNKQEASSDALVNLIQNIHKEVTTFDSIESICGALKTSSAKIVIIDLSIHQSKGVEFVKTISTEHPEVFVVVIAGSEEQVLVIDALRAGAFYTIDKSISIEEFKNIFLKIRAALSRRENRKFSFDTLRQASLKFTLNSSSKAIPPMVQIIKSLLHGFISEREILRIGLAVDEVLHNSYEHGNLGITSDEKQLACDNGSFEDLLKKRELQALEKGLVMSVNLTLNDSRFVCAIEDQGAGFDWQNTNPKLIAQSQSTDLYGRGVAVINKVFDEVSYLGKGNKIVLTKNLKISD